MPKGTFRRMMWTRKQGTDERKDGMDVSALQRPTGKCHGADSSYENSTVLSPRQPVHSHLMGKVVNTWVWKTLIPRDKLQAKSGDALRTWALPTTLYLLNRDSWSLRVGDNLGDVYTVQSWP